MLVLAAVLVVGAVSATPAFAHGGATSESASEIVLEAIAILEVHPGPSAAVDDKVRDALAAEDQSGVQASFVRSAGSALARGDIAATRRLLEQAVGACPDADILYVADQRARPPCVAPAHAFTLSRRSVGGTSEVVILVIAGILAVGGVAIIRHPRVRTQAERGVR